MRSFCSNCDESISFIITEIFRKIICVWTSQGTPALSTLALLLFQHDLSSREQNEVATTL
jgi:hypothetical protein